MFFVADSSLFGNCDTVTSVTNTGKLKFSLFVNPNPVNTLLNINYRSTENLQCEISDITGRIITRFTLYASLKNKVFDASRLPQGMFIIKVQSATGMIAQRKFIKD